MSEAACIPVVLFGDVMTGRGVDQILPWPGEPGLHEDYVRDAREYVRLAERKNGEIARPVGFEYVWGELLAELREVPGRVVVANVETSITASEEWWPGKGVHYRMHPRNVGCLKAGGIGCCCLANNHVMDWGYAGLDETLRTLDEAGLVRAGAGRNEADAASAVACPAEGGGRVIVVAAGSVTSGIPSGWAAGREKAGVNLVELSQGSARRVAGEVRRVKRERDVSVVSVHWGGNWGYEVPTGQVEFAHTLVDEGIDVVHGHSSHHAKGMEVYRGRLIVYGCGDLVNDYEGIPGHAGYRGDVRMVVVAWVGRDGSGVKEVRVIPLGVRRMRLVRAAAEDARWLGEMLGREGARFGTGVESDGAGRMCLRWR